MSTLSERQQEFTAYLVAGFPRLGLVGISPKGAAAFAGNGSVENNMNPVTHGPKDHGSDGSMQWRLDRLDGPHGLKGWAESQIVIRFWIIAIILALIGLSTLKLR